MPKYYAVIALRENEVDVVLQALRAGNMTEAAEWLEKNRGVYGRRNDDWRPFNGQTISELMQNARDGYYSATDLIEALGPNLLNLENLRSSNIEVFVIDIFACFFDMYRQFAQALDYWLASEAKCCFVISYLLPKGTQDQLIEEYGRTWRMVCYNYREGFLHRIAMRPDDLKNFRNHILKVSMSDDRPAPSTERELRKRWPDGKKDLPQLGRK